MNKTDRKIEVTIVGGGMITAVQILPSIYQLQRIGIVSDIKISALNSGPLKALDGNSNLGKAFPGQKFIPFPDFKKVDTNKNFPELYMEVIKSMKPYNVVVVAMPDHLHYPVIKEALKNNQHVMTVKPLVLNYMEAHEIEKEAYEKGLFVGVEYHKRFDDRSLIARKRYRAAEFGEFKIGHARLIEPWYYRNSNFQNWMTVENSDAFSYVACHYIDLVHFITGLLPVSVSVYGIVEKYPNGNNGFLWTDGRVIWNNGACLNVQNGLGYPDVGPGGNSQGLLMFMQGVNDGAMLEHSDQYRGIKHSYTVKGTEPGDTYYNEPNPDYFQFVYCGGSGLVPVGYGFRSIEAIFNSILRFNEANGIADKQKEIKKIDQEGIIATPANSYFNELVMEAGRKSILNSGQEVIIEYGDSPHIRVKEFH